jgi:hypothetical protein
MAFSTGEHLTVFESFRSFKNLNAIETSETASWAQRENLALYYPGYPETTML